MINDRTVLLTGATGGIGHALARHLAAEGGRLVLTGRREAELAALAEEVGGRYLVVDLAERDAVDRLLEDAGDVDVLVANAALPGTGLVSSFSAEQVDRVLDVNLRAPISLAHRLVLPMQAKGRGSLVFVASLAGLSSTAAMTLYNATKFGLRGFALGLHDELRPSGIGVTAVLPGFVRDAGMFAESGAAAPTVFGTCTPDDVARAVLKGIRTGRGEIAVGPPLDRLGARLGGFAPNLAATLKAKGLLGQVGEDMARGQQHKR